MPRCLMLAALSLVSAAGLVACNGGGDDDEEDDDDEEEEYVAEEVGLSILGNGNHTADGVSITVVANEDDDLDQPLDIAFNPRSMDQLWVVNYGSSRISLIFDVGTDDPTSESFRSTGSDHFLAKPAALAFSDFGNWASAQDTEERTQGSATPPDFMGPTLWDDNLDVFDAGHGSHLDMLHNSPLGGGMAWDIDNVYWLFDGYHSSITRYDFAEDHGYGGADHSDAYVTRWVEGDVERIEGVPSHLELDRDTGLLYIADTANNRIAVLDTATGEEGSSIRPNYDGTRQKEWDGADLWTLIDGYTVEEASMEAPAGLAIYDGMLYIGDHATGNILAFDLEGTLVDWLDTGRGEGALGGIDFDADGALFVTDISTNEILKIQAL